MFFFFAMDISSQKCGLLSWCGPEPSPSKQQNFIHLVMLRVCNILNFCLLFIFILVLNFYGHVSLDMSGCSNAFVLTVPSELLDSLVFS